MKIKSSTRPRLCARLDVKNSLLVKGTNFEGLAALGETIDFAIAYYLSGIDEIHIFDVVSSLYSVDYLKSTINRMSKDCFVPVSVGGGIDSLSKIETLLKLGADKVIINSASYGNYPFISRAAKEFGSSTICVAVDYIYESSIPTCVSHFGKIQQDVLFGDHIQRILDSSPGELILSSVDKDGTGQGFDSHISTFLPVQPSIPVIVHAGAGSFDHCQLPFENPMIAGCSISSLLHYNLLRERTDLVSKLPHNRTSRNVARKMASPIYESISPSVLITNFKSHFNYFK